MGVEEPVTCVGRKKALFLLKLSRIILRKSLGGILIGQCLWQAGVGYETGLELDEAKYIIMCNGQ